MQNVCACRTFKRKTKLLRMKKIVYNRDKHWILMRACMRASQTNSFIYVSWNHIKELGLILLKVNG